MTAVAPVATPTPAHDVAGTVAAVKRLPALLRRPVVMCLLLFAAYFGVSLANDPNAFLVSDVGGKVATLRSMDQRGDLDPDIGYWAESLDPGGTLLPLGNTVQVGDKWVNVTTVPMVYAAVPLYRLGGTRAILLLPMIAAVLVALGARALARRLDGDGDGDGDRAFWLVGLATPLLLYALDFWEHAPGLACMVWGVVVLFDVAEGIRGWRAALAGGMLLGAAATMRTEAFVYAVVVCGVLGIAAWRQRRALPVRDSVALVVGLAAVTALNHLLEGFVFGAGLRVARTSGAAGQAGVGLASRSRDALITSVGLNRFARPLDWFIGGVIVASLAWATWAFAGRRPDRIRTGWIALAIAGYGYALWLAQGLGFLPGALTASPLAVVGLVTAWRSGRSRLLALVAVVAAPIVWLVQYSGGTAPIWGGRYLLMSSTLLAVVGAVALGSMPRRAATAIVVLALLVTASGVVWASVRTTAFADTLGRLVAREEPLVVTQAPELLREAGAYYTPERRWLTAGDATELGRAAEVLDRAGAARFTLVSVDRDAAPARLGVFVRGSGRALALAAGMQVVATRFERVTP